jgi:hypothetical protein
MFIEIITNFKVDVCDPFMANAIIADQTVGRHEICKLLHLFLENRVARKSPFVVFKY